jgi:putative Holliday junction resolvase
VARILGIDFGRRRVGLAVSDPGQVIAQPLTTLIQEKSGAWWNQLDRILAEQEVEAIVVGYPLTMAGKSSQQTAEVDHFIAALRDRVEIPVSCFDERLTSAAARRALIQQGVKTGHRKDLVDRTAAALMLQDYLDSR